jgi:hypothetical protein
MISPAKAQEQEKTFEVYGYMKTDIGYNINQMNPDWIDLLRVTKLPSIKINLHRMEKSISVCVTPE